MVMKMFDRLLRAHSNTHTHTDAVVWLDADSIHMHTGSFLWSDDSNRTLIVPWMLSVRHRQLCDYSERGAGIGV